MGKLHVFEEIDERIPKRGEVYLSMGTLLPLLSTVDPDEDDYKRTILRRLTDEEVDALVTPKPADDERGRFVRETTVALIGRPVCESDSGVTWYMNEDEAFRQANQLADRFYRVKQP